MLGGKKTINTAYCKLKSSGFTLKSDSQSEKIFLLWYKLSSQTIN